MGNTRPNIKPPQGMKPVRGFPDYYVSRHGFVWSRKNGQYLQAFKKGNGYHQLSLFNDYGRYYKFVHRLVLQTFGGKRAAHLVEVDHLDENKSNNMLTNLEWVTHSENMKRRHARKRARDALRS